MNIDPVQKLTVTDVKLNLAELVKTIRKNENLTQEELAERLGLSRITISNLELGKNATTDTLLKVFQYLGIMDSFNGFISEQISNNKYKSLY